MGLKFLSIVALFASLMSCKSNPCTTQEQLNRQDLMRKAVESKTTDLSLPANIKATITDVVAMPDLYYGTAKVELQVKGGSCGSIYVSVVCSGECDTVFAKAIINPNAPEECYK
jgi:hypothetical protein